MSVKIENLEQKNMVKLTIEREATELDAAINKVYHKQKNRIAVPGFRKGKAPLAMIEKMYGAEVFFEDAKICASVLDLIITSKNKNSENPIPMAGIPHHSIEKYIPRLIAKGYKVAIAEQMTDPVP